MATSFLSGTNTRLLFGVGAADSAVTVTGVATDDTLMSVSRITNATNGTISSITDVLSSSSITAANTVTVSSATIDSNQLLAVLFADYDASV